MADPGRGRPAWGPRPVARDVAGAILLRHVRLAAPFADVGTVIDHVLTVAVARPPAGVPRLVLQVTVGPVGGGEAVWTVAVQRPDATPDLRVVLEAGGSDRVTVTVVAWRRELAPLATALVEALGRRYDTVGGGGPANPARLPRRGAYRRRWQAAWNLAKPLVAAGKGDVFIGHVLRQHGLPHEPRTVRRIIEAGQAGLLDG
jgi:hypothetical protein